MIADDSDAVTVRFLRMMRAEIGAERVGEDSLGRTADLARRWWGTGAAADARTRRRPAGTARRAGRPGRSARRVGCRERADRRRRAAHRAGPTRRGDRPFAANARRLRSGEITPAEFDELMARDRSDPDA
ncbi:hypothetical protein [Micromonospora sp. b486]|uniref:hypothetical protein n=1 Tax=Micromonospora sp. b486 TaxID=3053986 RepID=UPI00259CB163|nr:hypothetical protein [Micromonospora sp. b486]MDM4784504.1 hypothetical protein [Micromonospora sp. b486]